MGKLEKNACMQVASEMNSGRWFFGGMVVEGIIICVGPALGRS